MLETFTTPIGTFTLNQFDPDLEKMRNRIEKGDFNWLNVNFCHCCGNASNNRYCCYVCKKLICGTCNVFLSTGGTTNSKCIICCSKSPTFKLSEHAKQILQNLYSLDGFQYEQSLQKFEKDFESQTK